MSLQALTTPRNRRISGVFLVLTVPFSTAACASGINDSLPGIACLLAAAVCAILVVAHAWRTQRLCALLLLWSIVGGIAAAFLHEGLHALARTLPSDSLLRRGLRGPFVTFLLAAVILCPAVFPFVPMHLADGRRVSTLHRVVTTVVGAGLMTGGLFLVVGALGNGPPKGRGGIAETRR